MLDQLLQLDQNITLFFNGSNSVYLDRVMMTITSTSTWMPLAALLLYVLYKNNNVKRFILILLMISFCILCADQFASGFCKPFFHRFRPSHEPALVGIIDLVNGYKGGRYGFISSHAANTFSVYIFTALLFKNKRFTYILLSWPILNIWSRVYLGVHYFGDILVGSIWGIFVGFLIYSIYHHFNRQKSILIKDPNLTNSGYLVKDFNVITSFLLLTYVFVLIKSFFF